MDEQTARWNSPPMMPLPPSNVVACGSPLRFPEQIRLLPLLPQPPSLRIWGTTLLAPGCRVGVRYRLRLRIQARRASGSRLAAPASASSGVLPGSPASVSPRCVARACACLACACSLPGRRSTSLPRALGARPCLACRRPAAGEGAERRRSDGRRVRVR